jgi:hypothetical protein
MKINPRLYLIIIARYLFIYIIWQLYARVRSLCVCVCVCLRLSFFLLLFSKVVINPKHPHRVAKKCTSALGETATFSSSSSNHNKKASSSFLSFISRTKTFSFIRAAKKKKKKKKSGLIKYPRGKSIASARINGIEQQQQRVDDDDTAEEARG